MSRHYQLLGAVLVTAGLASCLSSKPSESLKDVDDLLERIERVHLESELAKERLGTAVGSLHAIVSPDFAGDPAEAYGAFVAAIEASEEQAEALHSSVDSMKKTSDGVFERWTTDLESFTSPQMRQRSRSRLEATRDRFEAIRTAVEPAQVELDQFNLELRDHALYLGYDFNAGSVAEISEDVRALTRRAAELDGRLVETLAAAETYVRSTALRGQVKVSHEEPEPQPGS